MRSRTGLVTEEWYSSPPIDLGERVIVFTGRTPWMRHSLRSDVIGDHARFIIDTIRKYERAPWWRLWDPVPRYFDIEDYEPPAPTSFVVELVGYAIAAVAAWRALRG